MFGVKTSSKESAYANKEITICSLRYENDGLNLENWGRDQLVQQRNEMKAGVGERWQLKEQRWKRRDESGSSPIDTCVARSQVNIK